MAKLLGLASRLCAVFVAADGCGEVMPSCHLDAKMRGIQVAAAAAKSLQPCPTLCDPIDASPPGSSVPGILQARILTFSLKSYILLVSASSIRSSLGGCLRENMMNFRDLLMTSHA